MSSVVATGIWVEKGASVGVGELVQVGVGEGTGVADATGVSAANDQATGVVVSLCPPDGEAAETVGKSVSVGDGLDEGLGSGLGA